MTALERITHTLTSLLACALFFAIGWIVGNQSGTDQATARAAELAASQPAHVCPTVDEDALVDKFMVQLALSIEAATEAIGKQLDQVDQPASTANTADILITSANAPHLTPEERDRINEETFASRRAARAQGYDPDQIERELIEQINREFGKNIAVPEH